MIPAHQHPLLIQVVAPVENTFDVAAWLRVLLHREGLRWTDVRRAEVYCQLSSCYVAEQLSGRSLNRIRAARWSEAEYAELHQLSTTDDPNPGVSLGIPSDKEYSEQHLFLSKTMHHLDIVGRMIETLRHHNLVLPTFGSIRTQQMQSAGDPPISFWRGEDYS